MKKSFVPLFMRYSKVPPRPNQKVQYDDPPLVEEQGQNFKDYPEDEFNKSGHEYFHNPIDEVDDCLDDKECMHKPDKDMMPMCPLAKSFVCWQIYGRVYSPVEAFRKGTIFPDLHKEYLR